MSAPVRMESPLVPLRWASGSGACCTVSESAAPIAAVPSTPATGLRRRARRLPDLVPVNRLQKEHPA